MKKHTKNVVIRPYVNFLEYEKNTKVKKAMKLLRLVLFPKTMEAKIICNNLDWKGWERAIVSGMKLKGKNQSLFLGHSRRWAGTPLT